MPPRPSVHPRPHTESQARVPEVPGVRASVAEGLPLTAAVVSVASAAVATAAAARAVGVTAGVEAEVVAEGVAITMMTGAQ